MTSPGIAPVTADVRARMTSPGVGVTPVLEPGGSGQAQISVKPDGTFRVVLPDSGRALDARGAGTIVTGRITRGEVSFDPVPNTDLIVAREHTLRGAAESGLRALHEGLARLNWSTPYAAPQDPKTSVTALLRAAEQDATAPGDRIHWRNWLALAEGRSLEPVSGPAHRSFTFPTKGTELTGPMRTYLGQLADDMTRDPSITVDVTGHASTMARAPNTNNDALAQQRAEAVRAFLRGRGIADERITARGVGTAAPASDPTGPIPRGRDNLAGDRRVDILTSGNGGLRVFLQRVRKPRSSLPAKEAHASRR